MTDTYLKRPNGQGHDQNCCRQQALQPAGAGIDNSQLLMLLPFEMMRQHLESVILRQFEIACGIYSKHAEELDNAFMKHVDKFEVTVRAELEEIYSTWQ